MALFITETQYITSKITLYCDFVLVFCPTIRFMLSQRHGRKRFAAMPSSRFAGFVIIQRYNVSASYDVSNCTFID